MLPMKKLIWLSVVVAFPACKKEEPAKKPAAASSAAREAPATPALPAGGEGSAAPPAEEQDTRPVPTCADALAHGLEDLDTGSASAGLQEKLQAIYLRRCNEDRWPVPVLRCYAAAAGMSAMQLCRKKMPPEQKSRLEKELMNVMAGGATRTPPAHGTGPVPVGGPPAASPK